MEFSLKQPMSVEEYKDRMHFPTMWRIAMVIVVLVGAAFMVIITGSSGWLQYYLWFVMVVFFAAFTSWTALQTQYNINNEWHLFRGDIAQVLVPEDETADVQVWFDDDDEDAYTIFSRADYDAHPGTLASGRGNVLIVRRTIVRGKPRFRGTFRA